MSGARIKVNRVDWWPADYIAGTFGQLTFEEHGAYGVLMNMISAQSGPIEPDYKRIAHAGTSTSRAAQRLVEQLVAKGKLQWTDDGRISNRRAMIEVERSQARVVQARHAADQAGAGHEERARERRATAEPPPSDSRANAVARQSQLELENENQPKSTTSPNRSVRSKSESKSKSGSNEESDALPSGRACARVPKVGSEIVNGGQQHDGKSQRLPAGWRPTPDQVGFARGEGLDPEAVIDGFVVYWTEGKGRREARTEDGWNRTWRNWCRRDAERRGGGASPQGGATGRPARGGGLAGAAARVRARYHGS